MIISAKRNEYRTSEDGALLVKRKLQDKSYGMTNVFSCNELWFPCSDEDADEFYLKVFLGGWFGYHRFKQGQFLYGLFYLFTCGCCGVFYLYDLLELLLGDYYYFETSYDYDDVKGAVTRTKRRIYYAELKNKKRAVVLFGVAFFLTVILVQFIYRPVGNLLLCELAQLISQGIENGGVTELPILMQ